MISIPISSKREERESKSYGSAYIIVGIMMILIGISVQFNLFLGYMSPLVFYIIGIIYIIGAMAIIAAR